jgi:hypothetical protein
MHLLVKTAMVGRLGQGVLTACGPGAGIDDRADHLHELIVI